MNTQSLAAENAIDTRHPAGMHQTLLAGLLILPLGALEVTILPTDYQPDPAIVPPGLRAGWSDRGGSTSIRNTPTDRLEWKTKGYYQRNRDLGQVFNLPAGADREVSAVVVRTGNSNHAVLPGAAGASLFIQFFRVASEPRIDDAGTSRASGVRPTHGLSGQYRADDRIVNVIYQPIALARGGRFPELSISDGRLRYLRFALDPATPLQLAAGGSYAFLIGIDEPAADAGFTLGNRNLAGSDDDGALLLDPTGQPWWGIRREGDGVFPPTVVPGPVPPADDVALRQASLLPAGAARFDLAPSSEGYPDVDTYRSLEFAVELRPLP